MFDHLFPEIQKYLKIHLIASVSFGLKIKKFGQNICGISKEVKPLTSNGRKYTVVPTDVGHFHPRTKPVLHFSKLGPMIQTHKITSFFHPYAQRADFE